MPERSWRCSTLFHQRSIWLRTMAGSSTKSTHRGQQIEQMILGAGNGREELPAWEDADASGRCSFDGHLFVLRLAAFGDLDTLLAEARVDGGEQVFGHGRFGQRQKLGFVEAGLRALRLGVELADGLDLVAEELDAHGAVRFGRVDIEDSAAAGELAGHLDQVHLRVADAGQMRGEDFDVDLFAAAQRDGEAGVVVATQRDGAQPLRLAQ